MQKKLKGGPSGIFQHPFCRQTSKNMKVDSFEEKNFSKKSLTMPKKTKKGDPLFSPGTICYAQKEESLFWFSSLAQWFNLTP